MGEAWFMGDDRHLHFKLLGDWEPLTAADLQQPLDDIVSGTSSFGPMDEWTSWYHFLLGTLLSNDHLHWLDELLEMVISGFIVMHPHGVQQGPYKEFRDDALRTLGRCLWDRSDWAGCHAEDATGLHDSQGFAWCEVDGAVSASMVFCLKYLPAPLIEPWLHSALSIAAPPWRAQIVMWLVGAHRLLTGKVRWPSEFPDRSHPCITWEGSHLLKPNMRDQTDPLSMATLIPVGNRQQAMQTLYAHFTEDCFLEWLLSFNEVPDLTIALSGTLSTFESLYVRRETPAG